MTMLYVLPNFKTQIKQGKLNSPKMSKSLEEACGFYSVDEFASRQWWEGSHKCFYIPFKEYEKYCGIVGGNMDIPTGYYTYRYYKAQRIMPI